MQEPKNNGRIRLALLGCAVLGTFGVAGCDSWFGDSSSSATDLIDIGPPMVRQVRFVEDTNANGGTFSHTLFGFGSFPGLTATDEHPVTSALASGNRFRIIMDELLQGNYLQQISCRGPIDAAGDTFGSVPSGATPDDIAKCCAAQDVLPTTCVGPYAVCVGPDPTHPVGVLDANQDGAADAQRFIPGSVGISCVDAAHKQLTVPIDLDNSYWNPSGDQLAPAMGGLDALGPAIVLIPNGALPTSTTCNLTFSTTVIDKTNMSVCIPPNGLPPGLTDDAGNVGVGCTPQGNASDYSLFSFGVEALRLVDSSPEDGDTGVSTIDPSSLSFNAGINPATAANITVTQAGQPFFGFTETLAQSNTQVKFTWTGGLIANTMYVITVPTTVTDAYGEGLPSAVTITFTTGA